MCILFVCCMLCSGAYMEQEGAIWTDNQPNHHPPRSEPRIPPLPPPAPAPRDSSSTPAAVTRFINSIRVVNHYSYRGLTVFPLEYQGRLPDLTLHTLDDAMRRGWVDIRERDDAEVGVVMIRNTGRRPVFLMNGELLTGGHQNRIIRNDILLEARSWPTPVSVYCVEQERWQGMPQATFTSANAAGSPSLRGKALADESQSSIWREVDEQHSAAKITSRTHNYQEVYADRDMARNIDAFTSRIISFLPRNIVGLAVARGDHIIGIDIFGTEALCSALREKLIRSYAVENTKHTRHESDTVGIRDIERLVRRIADADFTARDTPGAGTCLDIRGPVSGSALVWNNELVHLAVFEQ